MTPTATTERPTPTGRAADGGASAPPAPRFVAVCPLAACCKLSVASTREAAVAADRKHWSRVHAS